MSKMFGVMPAIQEKEIEEYCFKKCGKILIGGYHDDLIQLMPCQEEECPYEEKRLKYGTDSRGNVVWIRKLKKKEEVKTK